MKGVKVFRYAGLGVVGVFLISFALAGLSCVPAGHVGVVTTFGKLDVVTLGEGVSYVAPWKGVTKLSLQTREDREAGQVPTKEGLSVTVEASLLYSLSKEKAVEVYRTAGLRFEDVLVKPQFRSALRSATTHYEAKDLYTANREQIEGTLLKGVKAELEPHGIVVHAVLLRDVQLPQMVKERIEAKLAADQDAQRMQFVLKKEKLEAERKVAEAQGIADAQKIIKKDLDHNYLIYLWIEALKETAKHNNATIYIPTGPDGMPLFKEIGGKKGGK